MPKQKPYGDGKYTEAAFWGWIRSALRRKSMHWPPVRNAKIAARRQYNGQNKKMKWEYKCSQCLNYFPDKEVEVDHIIPCGSLRKETAGEFIEKLFCGSEKLTVLCKKCHHKKTHEAEQ